MELVIVIMLCLCLFMLATLIVVALKNKKSGGGDMFEKQIQKLQQSQNQTSSALNAVLLSAIRENNVSLLSSIANQNMATVNQIAIASTQLGDSTKQQTENMQNAIKTLENGLDRIAKDNEKKLEEMRVTVDEKLNANLENRLAKSFNIINEQLQNVYEGMGVMKSLAAGVTDLKKVLSGVKTRGVWGEMQLGTLLEQILTPNQFEKEVQIKEGSQDRVDYAIKMPGKDNNIIWLPIDAKFPLEDYDRVVEASENADKVALDISVKMLERRVKEEAKKISQKYIILPKTTDFAVLYLPIEGLYAEVLKIAGLVDFVQNNHKIVICGPSTLSALLNSLQLGFKSLEVEKRSSEVWQLLGVFKMEFSKFVAMLIKTSKKLNETQNIIESATKKSRTIEKKLKNVTLENELVETEEETLIDFEGEEE